MKQYTDGQTGKESTQHSHTHTHILTHTHTHTQAFTRSQRTEVVLVFKKKCIGKF